VSNDTARWSPTFGAIPGEDGTVFRVWAPSAASITLRVDNAEDVQARLSRAGSGLFEGRVEGAGNGSLYTYSIDGGDPYPDPASRFQPQGVHGPSQVVDWTLFAWDDQDWSGTPLDEIVTYEIHVGTFSPAGTFQGVIDRLAYLAELGVNAIELMPVAAFPGRWNWGYDGAALFAPHSGYGTPPDLQRLVNEAHRAGISVLLDVVYNHLGPDGAYLAAFSPAFFSSRHSSPWGKGINLDGAGSGMVRSFLLDNALHWIHEYHVDGLRLDATHALTDESPTHLLAQLADAVHAQGLKRHVHLIAEDDRNLATTVRKRKRGGWNLDAVWADDFHHQAHVLLTGEQEGYYRDFSGSVSDLATTINRGWFYAGQHSAYAGGPRGTEPAGIETSRFVFCLQNHDQVGNRATGDRLDALADPASVRAAVLLLLMAPETPLLFMGQEWAASTPFLYFTDHHAELGRLVTEGRRSEFARFPAFSDPATRHLIPDPQSEATFEASRLDWGEVAREPHASMLHYYRTLLRLRREMFGGGRAIARGRPLVPGADSGEQRLAWAVDSHTMALARECAGARVLAVARFAQAGDVETDLPGEGGRRYWSWRMLLTTEDEGFAHGGKPPHVEMSNAGRVRIAFHGPSAVLLRAARG
jgi:maltooligosyltrehalose trehalohydrolase